MVSVVQNVAIDCADAYELARFWSGVTGRPLHPEDRPGDREVQVLLEEGLWPQAAELEALGLTAVRSTDPRPFGGGQAIVREGDVLLGGSDGRKDGYAAGL